MKTKQLKKVLGIRIEPKYVAQLAVLADKQEMSVSALCRDILLRYIRRNSGA
jgi:predicted HicB family RNase H-like nuclease